MQQPVAEIIAVSSQAATVAVDAGVACARCAAGKGCGAGLLGPSGGTRRFDVVLPDGIELRPGDRVRLTLSPRQLLRASLVVYGLPLAAMVAVPFAAERALGPLSDGVLVCLAAAALAACVAYGRRRLRRDGCLRDFVPAIAGRVGGSAAE